MRCLTNTRSLRAHIENRLTDGKKEDTLGTRDTGFLRAIVHTCGHPPKVWAVRRTINGLLYTVVVSVIGLRFIGLRFTDTLDTTSTR